MSAARSRRILARVKIARPRRRAHIGRRSGHVKVIRGGVLRRMAKAMRIIKRWMLMSWRRNGTR